MQFSRNWIATYVELPPGVDELTERLTAAGLAVEGIEEVELPSGERDYVLDIDVTTNRPDAMNHLGLAREASVLFGKPLMLPEGPHESAAPDIAEAASVTVEEPELCPRFTALVIEGVKIGPSPAWLAERLEAIGLRAINNIVDVTNYVLWETGQPLHAFDLDRLAGAEIRVRRAHPDEDLVTLDGEKRRLDPEILVIADAERAVGLGGIMGGLDSEVTEKTTRVLIESAHFNPRTVRRGANKLGMHTDASHRFERGADPEACLWASRRAAALMIEAAGGRLREGAHDVRAEERPDWPPQIELELVKLSHFAGLEVAAEDVERILPGLGFALEKLGDGHWRGTVPSWRYYDFERPYPADLYEEVLRILGFDRITSTVPRIPGHDAPVRAEHLLRRRLQDQLAASGLCEAINFAFYSRAEDAAYQTLFSAGDALALSNPLSDRYAVMRRSLLPTLVASALYNQRHGASAVRLFEIGHVFWLDGDRNREAESVALVMGGRLGTPWERQTELDFYDLKGVLESLVASQGVELVFKPSSRPKLVDGTAADLALASREDEVIGYLGCLDEDDALYPLFVAELSVAPLLGLDRDLGVASPSRFPSIAMDSTLTHPLDVSWQQLAEAVRAVEVPDLVSFGLKDRYQGKGVPEGAVNTTLYFVYNAEQRSLSQEEVNQRHTELARQLQERFGLD